MDRHTYLYLFEIHTKLLRLGQYVQRKGKKPRLYSTLFTRTTTIGRYLRAGDLAIATISVLAVECHHRPSLV